MDPEQRGLVASATAATLQATASKTPRADWPLPTSFRVRSTQRSTASTSDCRRMTAKASPRTGLVVSMALCSNEEGGGPCDTIVQGTLVDLGTHMDLGEGIYWAEQAKGRVPLMSVASIALTIPIATLGARGDQVKGCISKTKSSGSALRKSNVIKGASRCNHIFGRTFPNLPHYFLQPIACILHTVYT